jgi:hypothetical protein
MFVHKCIHVHSIYIIFTYIYIYICIQIYIHLQPEVIGQDGTWIVEVRKICIELLRWTQTTHVPPSNKDSIAAKGGDISIAFIICRFNFFFYAILAGLHYSCKESVL